MKEANENKWDAGLHYSPVSGEKDWESMNPHEGPEDFS